MSVNVISSEDIENYKQMLEKHMTDKAADAKHDDYYAGYFDGLKKAIALAEKLNESKKVVIPRFVADWIDEKKRINSLLEHVANATVASVEGHMDVGEWLESDENVLKLVQSWVNGYEVEEKRYRIKIGKSLYFEKFRNNRAWLFVAGGPESLKQIPTFTEKDGCKILRTLTVKGGQLEEAED